MNTFINQLKLVIGSIFVVTILVLGSPAYAQAPDPKLHELAAGSYKFPLPSEMNLAKEVKLPDISSRTWSSVITKGIGPLPGDIGVVLTCDTFSEKLWAEVGKWKVSDFFSFKEQVKQRGGINEISEPLWKNKDERSKLEKMWKECGDIDGTFGKDSWMAYEVIVNSRDKRLFTTGTVGYGGGMITATTTEGNLVYQAVDVYIVSAKDRSLYTIRMFGGDSKNYPPSYMLLALARAKAIQKTH